MQSCYRSFLLLTTAVTIITSSLSAHAQQATLVEVIKPIVASETQSLRISGSLTAEKHSLLSPRVDGLVDKVFVDAGSQVKKGETLLKLDTAITQHQLAQAKANVTSATIDRDEAQRLVAEAERLRKQSYVPESEVAKRKATLALKKSELSAEEATKASIEETLRRHALTAPFSGVINKKMTEAGEWVSRGDSVLELVNLDAIRLDVYVPQERFADINHDTAVLVVSDAYPDQQLAGQIQAIVPVSDAQVRAFLVRITLDNKSHALLPGTSASAIFAIKPKHKQNLIVPRDALLHQPDGSASVFIVEDNKALRKQVQVGRFTDNGVSIVAGIEAAQLVIIRGNEVLRDQQAVQIIRSEP